MVEEAVEPCSVDGDILRLHNSETPCFLTGAVRTARFVEERVIGKPFGVEWQWCTWQRLKVWGLGLDMAHVDLDSPDCKYMDCSKG